MSDEINELRILHKMWSVNKHTDHLVLDITDSTETQYQDVKSLESQSLVSLSDQTWEPTSTMCQLTDYGIKVIEEQYGGGEKWIEATALNLKCEAPRANPDMVDLAIKDIEYAEFTTKGGKHLTWCVLTLDNGYTCQGEPSIAASPENNRVEIARNVSYNNSRQEAWKAIGFRICENRAAAELARAMPGAGCHHVA